MSTAHLALQTDLAGEEALALAQDLEAELLALASYLDRPPRGILAIHVVRDVSAWPADAIPTSARPKLAERAGVTETEVLRDGDAVRSATAIVFASAARDSARHELVHAYLGQTFGVDGPVWFAEGMAEVGRYWRAGERGVRCEPRVAAALRAEPAPSLAALTAPALTGDSWREYARRWALCHLLAEHPAYAERFQRLARRIVRAEPGATLEATFADDLPRLAWEYRLFLRQIEPGYRVELCGWDWQTPWQPLPAAGAQTAQVDARRGWQASGLEVTAGQPYRCQAQGVWRLAARAAALTADGDSDGHGRLDGAIWSGDGTGAMELTGPIALGTAASFRPGASGRLMLRCRDAWGELSDNSGQIEVTLRHGD